MMGYKEFPSFNFFPLINGNLWIDMPENQAEGRWGIPRHHSLSNLPSLWGRASYGFAFNDDPFRAAIVIDSIVIKMEGRHIIRSGCPGAETEAATFCHV